MYMKVAVDRVRRADDWWVVVMIGSEREEHGPYDQERAAAEEQLELVEEFQLRTGDGREVTLLPVGISVSPRPLSVEGLRDALSDNGLDVAVARLPGTDQDAAYLVLVVHAAEEGPRISTELVLRSIEDAGLQAGLVPSLNESVADALLRRLDTVWTTTVVGAAALDLVRWSNGQASPSEASWRSMVSLASADSPVDHTAARAS